MHRVQTFLFVVVIVLVGAFALRGQPQAAAQDATPAADERMGGLTFDPLAYAAGVEVLSPADLAVSRIGLEPGAGFPIDASDPSSALFVVESGVFTASASAPWTVTRAATMAAAATGSESPAPETVAAGEEATLEAGDSAYIPGNVSGEVRNDGTERAVGLAFIIGPPTGDAATPAP